MTRGDEKGWKSERADGQTAVSRSGLLFQQGHSVVQVCTESPSSTHGAVSVSIARVQQQPVASVACSGACRMPICPQSTQQQANREFASPADCRTNARQATIPISREKTRITPFPNATLARNQIVNNARTRSAQGAENTYREASKCCGHRIVADYLAASQSLYNSTTYLREIATALQAGLAPCTGETGRPNPVARPEERRAGDCPATRHSNPSAVSVRFLVEPAD